LHRTLRNGGGRLIIVVVVVLLALAFAMPRMRERARLRARERELGQRRDQAASEHRDQAAQLSTEADAAEQRVRIAEQEAARQRAARDDGRHVGLGLGCYGEGTGVGPFESALGRIDPSGKIVRSSGGCPIGRSSGWARQTATWPLWPRRGA